jgi:hypothetical protein
VSFKKGDKVFWRELGTGKPMYRIVSEVVEKGMRLEFTNGMQMPADKCFLVCKVAAELYFNAERSEREPGGSR